jgi:hypothetical protein
MSDLKEALPKGVMLITPLAVPKPIFSGTTFRSPLMRIVSLSNAKFSSRGSKA